ncbi:MAG TPA: hypothetical protein VN873_10510 [Candidatus Angelobacter sp.]|nr:hypothetical protein [Candidatus Angelobacter sp.]
MKIKFVTLIAAVFLTGGVAGIAQTTTTTTTTTTHIWNDPHAWWQNHWSNNGAQLYTANEASLDLFGSYLSGEHKIENVFHNSIRHGFWGGGVGINYFFTRELGIGGDINIPDDHFGHFVNNIDGSLIARMPIGNCGLAPYIFGGGGRQTDPVWQWTGHAGVGVEYRFNPGTAFFTDARYVWVDKTPDEILFRAGLKLVF